MLLMLCCFPLVFIRWTLLGICRAKQTIDQLTPNQELSQRMTFMLNTSLGLCSNSFIWSSPANFL